MSSYLGVSNFDNFIFKEASKKNWIKADRRINKDITQGRATNKLISQRKVTNPVPEHKMAYHHSQIQTMIP